MLGIYFSGSGNTKHCTELMVQLLDAEGRSVPMESEAAERLLTQHDCIVLGYPVYYSNVPVVVRDFIIAHSALWRGKQVFCLATMGLFSGDGAGCSARLLKRYGAQVIGGLHLKMPDCICDVKLLKYSSEENRAIVKAADQKIEAWAQKCKRGEYPQEGLRFYNRLAGLLGQRLWFYGKTRTYSNKLKISDACTGCGLCSGLCPMGNLEITQGRAIPADRCTMCYRCINSCPAQAITLLGKRVIRQYNCDTYL